MVASGQHSGVLAPDKKSNALQFPPKSTTLSVQKNLGLRSCKSEGTQISPNSAKICVGITTVATIAAASFMEINQAAINHPAERAAHAEKVLTTLQTVYAKILKVESVTRGYTLTKDKKFLELREETAKQVNTALDEVKELTANNAQQQASLEKLHKLMKDRVDFIKHYLMLQEQNLLSEDEIKEFVETGADMTVTLEKQLAEMQNVETAIVEQKAVEFETARSHSKLAFFLLIGSAIALALSALSLCKKPDAAKQD